MSKKEELNRVIEAQYRGFYGYLIEDLPDGPQKEESLASLNESQVNAHAAVETIQDPADDA